eukprot:127082_1
MGAEIDNVVAAHLYNINVINYYYISRETDLMRVPVEVSQEYQNIEIFQISIDHYDKWQMRRFCHYNCYSSGASIKWNPKITKFNKNSAEVGFGAINLFLKKD